jgi:DNA repair photolyase
MKQFDGKAIYNPSGKAGEYSRWACNFYVGCSNGCQYCYLRKGILKPTMGGDKPTLKKCFKNEGHAFIVFREELKANSSDLRKHGLFFSFTTDPMLPETIALTKAAINECVDEMIPVQILTKKTGWIPDKNCVNCDGQSNRNGGFPCVGERWKKYVSFGFTLTGHDELEPNASSNAERIEAMRKLRESGFKTWASIEPVIDFESSFKMVLDSRHVCDLYKIGLESGKKYDIGLLNKFIDDVIEYTEYFGCKLYFKDGLLKQAGMSRSALPANCVTRDYNLFKNR